MVNTPNLRLTTLKKSRPNIFSASQLEEDKLQIKYFKILALLNGYYMITNDKGKKVPFETDIFLDGIVPMIESSIIAQTFGAPAPYEPTCDTQ